MGCGAFTLGRMLPKHANWVTHLEKLSSKSSICCQWLFRSCIRSTSRETTHVNLGILGTPCGSYFVEKLTQFFLCFHRWEVLQVPAMPANLSPEDLDFSGEFQEASWNLAKYLQITSFWCILHIFSQHDLCKLYSNIDIWIRCICINFPQRWGSAQLPWCGSFDWLLTSKNGCDFCLLEKRMPSNTCLMEVLESSWTLMMNQFFFPNFLKVLSFLLAFPNTLGWPTITS